VTSAAAHHDHHHHHHHGGTAAERLRLALLVTVTTMGVSVLGGVLARSLALLSDAGHMLADAGALALALAAQRIADRPRTVARTYGSRRAETLAAFLNALLLAVAALWVVGEALERWQEPREVRGGLMIGFAVFGLLANLVAAWLLSRGEGGSNANTRAALFHVMADAGGSVAAILAGVCVFLFGWNRADPLISLLVAVLILWSAWKLVTRALDVLMEGVPLGLDVAELEKTILETPGVSALHDLHAWSIAEGFDSVTVHVVLDGSRHGTDVAVAVSARVRERHHIAHVTVQPEAPPLGITIQPVSELLRRRRT
jgi:cobalt-zinc-cadmium efflux system protein